MACDCGIFNKLKRGMATGNSNDNGNGNKGKEDKGKEGDSSGNNASSSSKNTLVKDNRMAPLCKSPDWSEFEGVKASAFYSAGGELRACRFLTEVSQILMQYYVTSRNSKNKLLDFHHPHQLREMMGHCLDLDESPRDLEQLLSDCKETLKYCVKTGHGHFFNQLSTGLDIVGLAGEWLTAVSNTNMFTYEVAPVFTLMEDVVLRRMLSKVGWEDGDGTFAPGGAVSNLYGVLLARHHTFPNVKTEGMPSCAQPVVFTSEQSHFSIKRACVLLGLGTNNYIKIPCDSRGKMVVSELEQQILAAKREGKVPMMVNAMCGTTVMGAFDPTEEIADL
ncbi:hypothetical protein V1264_008237 [Littorina saxatilis]|uniref:Glutamate decarboxylase n=1 Tax=Littorina saxatilis TaxID=31220 RepID=A0AAN9ASQ9_9CAEN